MFAIAVAFIILGYSLAYTGTVNLLNGGQGPSLFEAMGVKTSVSYPGSDSGVQKVAMGTGNQTGAPPSNPNPSPASTVNWQNL